MEEEKKQKKKSLASIPDNYVSILQLQERWLKEKERKQRKQKDSVERGVKAKQQQVDHEQPRRQEESAVKPKEKGLCGVSRMHSAVDRCKKESKWVKKEELEVSAAIVSNKDEVGGDPREKKKSDPVKEDTRRVFTSKGEHAAKEETKFQKRWIKKRVEEEVKGPTRLTSGQGYYRNQRHDWSIPTRAMVWVKKGNNHGAAGENGVLIIM
ncbi:PREDICTED: DNA ligase 1-like [Camelina sativa]|uniref:DNA ligase 1-like n=1 Tax=Camelina sativa TaxID=90675 RepID=A0ABM0XHI5_CAMSA|nr:PREDICTED: DNA ligase 1-like [Camelina sativa]